MSSPETAELWFLGWGGKTMPEVFKEVAATGTLNHGHTVAGMTPTQLCAGFPCTKGVLIRAPGPDDAVPNYRAVWIGRKHVTADSAPGTGGYPLMPGASIVLPIDDPSQIYIVSDIEEQEVSWIGA